ncbi:MAG: hypothetical protein NTW51_09900 [Cyanobacteria bacterium]|nr:hypothetical protein [Cyanobacteriota bacterium]
MDPATLALLTAGGGLIGPMTSRTFHYRLRSSHAGPDLTSQSVVVERRSEEGEWQPQNPSLNTPPFRLHLIALLLCLHLHLVSEARERQIPLQQVVADLSVTVSNSWDLEAVVASFQLRLDPGASPEARAGASDQAISAMRERMQHSPVPRNRPAAVPLTLNIALQN